MRYVIETKESKLYTTDVYEVQGVFIKFKDKYNNEILLNQEEIVKIRERKTGVSEK